MKRATPEETAALLKDMANSLDRIAARAALARDLLRANGVPAFGEASAGFEAILDEIAGFEERMRGARLRSNPAS